MGGMVYTLKLDDEQLSTVMAALSLKSRMAETSFLRREADEVFDLISDKVGF